MNKVTKKLEKLVREREAAKVLEAKRKPVVANPQMTLSFAKSPTAATVATKTKSNLNKTISVTVSINPKKTVYPTAFAVKYEVKKEKSYMEAHSPNRQRPEKRDPILQTGNEEVFISKGKSRQHSPFKATSLISEDPIILTRAMGECSPLNRNRIQSPERVEAKKMINKQRNRTSETEDVRNKRKMVQHPSINLYNPITEGSKNMYVSNERKHVRPRTATQNLLADIIKQADLKKPQPPVDMRAVSPKGRVFRDGSMTAACIVNENVRESSSSIRCNGKDFRGKSMKGLMNYSYALPFRQDNISPKCNALNSSTVVAWNEQSIHDRSVHERSYY